MIEVYFPGMEEAGMTKFDIIKAISKDLNKEVVSVCNEWYMKTKDEHLAKHQDRQQKAEQDGVAQNTPEWKDRVVVPLVEVHHRIEREFTKLQELVSDQATDAYKAWVEHFMNGSYDDVEYADEAGTPTTPQGIGVRSTQTTYRGDASHVI